MTFQGRSDRVGPAFQHFFNRLVSFLTFHESIYIFKYFLYTINKQVWGEKLILCRRSMKLQKGLVDR